MLLEFIIRNDCQLHFR